MWDLRFGVPGQFDVRRCVACNLEQVWPVLAPEDLADTYERYYNFRAQDTPTYQRRRGWLVQSGLYRLWTRVDGDISFVLEPGRARRLLDVGCNEGRNLALFEASGFEVVGVEPNPQAASVAAGRGLTLYPGGVGDIPVVVEPFDVIVMSNVLEHVHDAVAILTEARRRLRPRGELWVSAPNAQSWFRRLFGRYWINWHPPFHLVHFSAETLDELLYRTGFDVIERKTKTPALWVAQSILARRYAHVGKTTDAMRKPLVLAALLLGVRFALFPLLWLANRLGRGDCLVVKARLRTTVG